MRVFSLYIFYLSAFIMNASAHEAFLNAGTIGLSGGDSNIQLSPGFSYTYSPFLQFSANITLSSASYMNNSVFSLSGMLGPTINIGDNIQNAYFIMAGLAFKTASATDSTGVAAPAGGSTTASSSSASTSSSGSSSSSSSSTLQDPSGVGFGFMFGKRFPLYGPVAYRPSIGVMVTGTMGFVINIFAASYSF